MRFTGPHGTRLLAIRAVWMALTVLVAGLSVALLIDAYAHYPSACTECRSFWRISPEDVLALRELGLSVGIYAAYGLVIEMIYLLGFWAIGAIIFLRKGDDRVALFFSLVLVIFGTLNAINLSVGIHPTLDLLGSLFSYFAYLAFFASFYVFPNGRFVPRWTRWMVIAWALYLAVLFFIPEDSPFYPATWPLLLVMVLVVGLFGSMVLAQVYRYRRVSGPSERQQTKWVVFGLTAAIVGSFIAALPAAAFPELVRPGAPRILYALFELTLTNLSLLLIPLSIGIAILRYRLWDIDLIINRALVYSTLTATLSLIFFGGVTLLEGVFRNLTGGESELAIIASTLAIAALFEPLRRRIHAIIDRRFYRKKYDARKTLETFGEKLRAETDLNALCDDLVKVVRATMQPAHVSVWLRPDSGWSDHHTPRHGAGRISNRAQDAVRYQAARGAEGTGGRLDSEAGG